MERTKGKDDGTMLFRKFGRGSTLLIIDGTKRRIKFNQVFRARPDEIPNAFKDTILPIEKSATEGAKTPPTEVKPKEYFVQAKGGGWYDVVSADGKVQNESSLRKAQAETFRSSLM